jgi:hypothetical protein
MFWQARAEASTSSAGPFHFCSPERNQHHDATSSPPRRRAQSQQTGPQSQSSKHPNRARGANRSCRSRRRNPIRRDANPQTNLRSQTLRQPSQRPAQHRPPNPPRQASLQQKRPQNRTHRPNRPPPHRPPAAYEALIARFQKKYNPANPEETTLVQSIINTTWRLRRITTLDFAIFATGAVELADEFPDVDDPDTRAQLIQAQTYLKYAKQLRNLHTQEARLQRLLDKETAELQRLQSARLQMEAQLQALRAAKAAKNQESKTAAPEVGFEFENLANLDATLTAAAPNFPAEHSI